MSNLSEQEFLSVVSKPSVQLMFGDCLERMKEIPDGSVDMILSDPPYGTTACKWDSIIDLTLMWEQLKRVAKPNGAILIMAAQPYTSVLVCSNLKMYKHNWVWEKSRSGSAISAKYCPVKIHEDVLVFCKGSPCYYPIMEKGDPYSRKCKTITENNHKFGVVGKVDVSNTGTRYPKTVRFEKQNWSKQQQVHPTQKPVSLMEYMIRTYTNEGEIVLDFTMGSGTTGVACINTNRSFIGIEMDENYFNIAQQRINEAKGST